MIIEIPLQYLLQLSQIGGQYIDVAIEQNPCVQSLNLAD